MSAPSKFRKKPIAVEACQWFKNGDHPEDRVGEILHDPLSGEQYERYEGAVVRYYRHPKVDGAHICDKCGKTMHNHGWLDTLEGGNDGAQVVCPSDWIITGVRGERYPVKDSIFGETYEPVPESA